MSTSCRRRRRRDRGRRGRPGHAFGARVVPPAHVRGDCGVPRDRRGRLLLPRERDPPVASDERDAERGALFVGDENRAPLRPAGEAVLALLSDGRLAIASARRATEWEETVEDVADEDDELEYAKEASHLHHSVGGGDDDGACVKLEAVVVSPAGGAFSVLEREDDVPRRVAWLDAETALVAADRPSDGSASLLTVRLSFAYPRDSRVARGSREPRWSCEVVSAVDLPAPANAVARAEGESPPGAFVQMQEHGDTSVSSVSRCSPRSSPTSTATLSSPRFRRAGPRRRCRTRAWRSPRRPGGAGRAPTSPASTRAAFCAAALASSRATCARSPCTSGTSARPTKCSRKTTPRSRRRGRTPRRGARGPRVDAKGETETTSCGRPEARLVYATLADELRVVDLVDVFVDTDDTDDTDDRVSDPTPTDGRVSDDARTFETGNAFATAAGGTRANHRGDQHARPSRKKRKPIGSERPHARLHARGDASRGRGPRHRQSHASYRAGRARRRRTPRFCRRRAPDAARQSGKSRRPASSVLPFLARALDARATTIAAAVAARHRVDLNVIVDRAWPRFLKHADAFVRDVDDPDVVAEILECLDGGDCTAPGAPCARLPTPAPEAEDAALLERANFEKINDEEDPVAVGSIRGLLTGPSLDLARLARAMTNDASSGASSGAEGPPGASRRTPRNDPRERRRLRARTKPPQRRALAPTPGGKIRLTCSAIARAVARVAAEKDAARRMRREDGEKTREDGGVVPSSADETRAERDARVRVLGGRARGGARSPGTSGVREHRNSGRGEIPAGGRLRGALRGHVRGVRRGGGGLSGVGARHASGDHARAKATTGTRLRERLRFPSPGFRRTFRRTRASTNAST